jgi:glycosyltransferase involved in cell wall biosynthesis
VRKRFDVCAAVVSDLQYDARVWKEARSLAVAGYSVVVLGCAYDLSGPRRRRAEGVEVVEIPLGMRGKPSLPRRAQTLMRLWIEIIRTPARVYHAHNVHTAPPAWLASRLRRARLVYDAHELYGEGSDANLPRLAAIAGGRLERFIVRRSDAVITTNRFRAEVLRERHGAREVEVLANVPPLSLTVEPLDPGYPDGPVVLYQGGIYARSRAFRETIAALALLEEVSFAVVGFGRDSDIELIKTWAAEAGVSGRVHLFPPRPFDELVRTAAAATIGLVPIKPDTLNNALGDTNKLYEYLMAGLPVAASDLPELRRIVCQGDPAVGEIFDPSSPESIAGAIRRLLDDPRYAERRREARRLAVEQFNWEAEEVRLLDIYERFGLRKAAPR